MTITTATQTRKLGKLPVRTDVRTLHVARYVDRAELPAPPPALDLADRVGDWPMYANDRIGDCTIAAAGHMVEAWTAESRGRPVAVSERSVLDAFDHVKRIDPATGEEGAVVLDVLGYWRRHGIGRHRIGAYAQVPVHDHELARASAWLFGGLYVGVELPLTARRSAGLGLDGRARRPGQAGVVGRARGRPRPVRTRTGSPSSRGGSCRTSPGRSGTATATRSTRSSRATSSPSGKAPNGFDLAALKADLQLVTA